MVYRNNCYFLFNLSTSNQVALKGASKNSVHNSSRSSFGMFCSWKCLSQDWRKRFIFLLFIYSAVTCNYPRNTLFFDYKKGMVLKRDKAVKWSFGFAIVTIILFYSNFNGALMLIPLFSGWFFYMIFALSLQSKGSKEFIMQGKNHMECF